MNGKSLEDNPIPQLLQYHPAVGKLQIRGRFAPTRPQDSRSIRKVYTCRPASTEQEAPCAKQILTTLMRRAFRRPVTPTDMEWVQGFYLEGRHEGTFQDGIELAVRRILTSPQFLVRAEREPANVALGQPYRITDLELASRLSFFLWSSIPDDQLVEIASQNKLHVPATLDHEVRRMLADPGLMRWSRILGTSSCICATCLPASPDGVFYPNWDDELRKSFRRETELLFQSIVRENRSVTELLDADYTFLNERLAKHYRNSQHLRIAVPSCGARLRSRLPARATRTGQRPGAHLAAEFQNVSSEARSVGPRKYSGNATAGTPAERAAA